MPSYYLTDEAREKRLVKLAEKIVAEPAKVPVSVQRKVIRELSKIVRDRKDAA